MTIEDRRAQILDAVLPAIAEHGAAITSRQLAEAAGVAEGTLFRSFGDKESLLRAGFERASEHAFDLDALPEAPDATLEQTVELLSVVLADRFEAIFRLAVALGPVLDGDRTDQDAALVELRAHLATLLERFADELRVTPAVAADVLCTLAFTAASGWSESSGITLSDVGGILLHGIAARPAPTTPEEAS